VSGPTPRKAEQAGGAGGDQRDDLVVQAVDLVTGELGAAAQLPQRDLGGVADDLAGQRP
jgi:hypothetical protein